MPAAGIPAAQIDEHLLAELYRYLVGGPPALMTAENFLEANHLLGTEHLAEDSIKIFRGYLFFPGVLPVQPQLCRYPLINCIRMKSFAPRVLITVLT